MQWGDPQFLAWLWAVPLAVMLGVHAIIRRRRSLRRFIASGLLPKVVPGGGFGVVRAAVKSLVLAGALACLVLAIARPRFNLPGERPPISQVTRTGRDVCFLIDVSKSMLAEDLKPNRLQRATLWLKDVLESVRGDRVALVAFAGTSVVKCPLTHDYAFVRLQLEGLSPSSVTIGGTNIGDAVRHAVSEVFGIREGRPAEASFKDIILITDGEDTVGSQPLDAAAAAGAAGVRLITIGIGDDSQGARLPITDDQGRRTFITSGGREVVSRLDSATLQRMALATPGGVSFNVGVGTIELDKIYKGLIDQAEKREIDSTESETPYAERFRWVLGMALFAMVVELFIGERRREKRA